MVGVCGAFGEHRPEIDPLLDWIDRGSVGEIARTDEAGLTCVAATHEPSPQPISVPERGATLVVIGTVYGRRRNGSWERRPIGVSTPAYCARAYAADGLGALTELNGEFVACVLEREERTLRLVTDLLGSRPVYYHSNTDRLRFSSSVQSLVGHPDVPAAFDPASLVEYLAHKTVRGIETPFEDVAQLPPASIVTVNAASPDRIECERYWYPTPQPRDRPIDRFVDRFVDRFTDAIGDRIRADRRHGLLLSGGSDSRLLAAVLEPDRAYGFAAGSAGESTVAARVADAIGVHFTRFELGPDRTPALLEGYARHGNGIGWFNEARTLAVADELRADVDALVSGLYADVFFKGWTLSRRRVPTPFGELSLPIERQIDDLHRYMESRAAETPSYVDTDEIPDARRVLKRSLETTADGVRDHGIDHPSVAALDRTGFWYPLTNETSFDRYGDAQVLPTVYPFLDRRLIELSLELPRSDAVRHNVVNRAVSRLAPDLAAIPHNESGVSLDRAETVHWLARIYRDRLEDSSGGANAETLREGWLPTFLEDREATIRALPGIDYEAVRRRCRDHRRGENHTGELSALVSLLAMPATRTAVESEDATIEPDPGR
ncbi:asparagine synthase-related protein [Natronococcus occultus]|uniref:Asparagine synthase (Glutamine-hydrolyzing) n=1 Tax=Natronococcus occultus SP4 TaxID=694430 RepID=L0JZA5_9EURY|nr:asparagine synthase-related protein [Natronococcus occultus]AGB38091.1 asparagine synthase (glutamine-hydrolyzing) [Natronococcus occultus SP4]